MKTDAVREKVSEFYNDVITGLTSDKKYLPSKYFYDEKGSDLFEQICELDEYYPTDCEVSIMQTRIGEIADMLGDGIQLIELGSGSSMKTRLLLDHCDGINMYVPVDISAEFLNETANVLRRDYPGLDIRPVAADYTSPFEIPESESESIKKRVVYFPGSTIGNFKQNQAAGFLTTIAKNLSPGDGLLIGVDLKKDVGVLEAAYNDSRGITAEFNKNILAHINRELNANFNMDLFQHRAFYNASEGRIEMHLESLDDQSVQINGTHINFKKGETIHTENSHKYSVSEIETLTGDLFKRKKTWMDDRNYFSVHYFERV